MTAITRFVDRFGSKDAEAEEDIHAASDQPGTVPLRELVLRRRSRIAGVIVAVTRSLPEDTPRLDIVVSDGTGSVAARFLGRRSIPGVVTGRVIVIEGRFGLQDGDVMALNPAYRLIGAVRR